MADQMEWDSWDEAGIFSAYDEETLELDDRDIEAECQAVELDIDDDSDSEYVDADDWTLYADELRRLGIRVKG